MKSCIHGHELTPENVYLTPRGHVQCCTCRRLSQQRVRERIKTKMGPIRSRSTHYSGSVKWVRSVPCGSGIVAPMTYRQQLARAALGNALNPCIVVVAFNPGYAAARKRGQKNRT